MTKQEIWDQLRGGWVFRMTSPGDWQFRVKEVDGQWVFVLEKVR